MPCQIKIDSVVPVGSPGQLLTSVEVKGTAAGCDSVVVKVSCGGPQDKLQTLASPYPPGSAQTWAWQALFDDLTGTGCTCGDPSVGLTVTAYCKAEPDCSDRTHLQPIPCKPEQYCCPVVNVKYTEGGCDAQGRRLVTFEIKLTPAADPSCPPTVVAQLNFGDGTYGQAYTVPPNNVWTETHAYAPGTYTARLIVIVPSGCKDTEIKVGPLEECPCPTVTLGEPSVQGCAGPHDVSTVTVKATVASAVAGCLVNWTFDDGHEAQATVPANAPSFENTQSHSYSTHGLHAVSVTIQCGLCSDSDTAAFAIPKCKDGDGNGGRPCPWWDPRCWKWNWCVILGILLALAIAAYLLGIAYGAAQAVLEQLPEIIALILGGAVTAEMLVGVIGGFLGAAIVAYLSLCGPCYLRNALLAGVALAVAVIIVLLIAGSPPPYWWPALLVAIAFVLAAWAAHHDCVTKGA